MSKFLQLILSISYYMYILIKTNFYKIITYTARCDFVPCNVCYRISSDGSSNTEVARLIQGDMGPPKSSAVVVLVSVIGEVLSKVYSLESVHSDRDFCGGTCNHLLIQFTIAYCIIAII